MTAKIATPPVVPAQRQNPAPPQTVFGTAAPIETGQFSAGVVQRASVTVPLRWLTIVVAGLVVALVVFGLGIIAGQNSPAAQHPDGKTLAVLSYAQAQNPGQTCYAVWQQGDGGWTVKCGALR